MKTPAYTKSLYNISYNAFPEINLGTCLSVPPDLIFGFRRGNIVCVVVEYCKGHRYALMKNIWLTDFQLLDALNLHKAEILHWYMSDAGTIYHSVSKNKYHTLLDEIDRAIGVLGWG